MTTWIREKSYKVRLPRVFKAETLAGLRNQLQDYADRYRPGPDAPELGELLYQYELDENDEVCVVRAYFINRHDKKGRFARLVRKDS